MFLMFSMTYFLIILIILFQNKFMFMSMIIGMEFLTISMIYFMTNLFYLTNQAFFILYFIFFFLMESIIGLALITFMQRKKIKSLFHLML
uniref:NADH dehydrogenase subunit 4L n=1 Tax=Sclerodermus sichuanensis TaxID=592144 RepID=UPI0021141CDE|nr:NADH dehydrogenase subunit 4L [Sclerodermus sichuanensis]UTN43176.1 NADH dehydrogenase subunit 4L [Sclerodermus sichuanensis]